MLTPFIAGIVAEDAGYEALFAIALVMTVAALLVMVRYIHDPHEEPIVVPATGD